MYRTLDHVFMRTSASPILFRILPNQKSLMFLALGSLISYGNVQPMRFLSDKSEKPKPLKELCRPYLFKIGPEKFYFHLNEHQIDMFTFISIIQFNRTTRTEHHIWISIPAAKILVKKLKDMDNVEKIEGDSLKRMRSDEVLYEDAFLNCEINEEITLKLLPSRDGYLGIFCLANFELEIRRKSLPDESKESHIYVSSNVIHPFKKSLAGILKRYEKLQDPNRPSGYKPLRVKSFDFGPVRYFLSLNETVKGIYMQLGESNSKAGIRRSMIIPITAAELMLPILGQAYEVILQNEGRSPMEIQPRTSLFEKCFIDSGREFTVYVKVSELAFRNFGDMILLLRSQDVQNELSDKEIGEPDEEFDDRLVSMGLLHGSQTCDNCGNPMKIQNHIWTCHRRACRQESTKLTKGLKHKKFCIIIRSNGVPTFLKHFKRMLQKFEKLKPAKTETAQIEQLPKPRSDSIEYQPEQQHTLKDLCKPSLFKIGSEEFYFNLIGRLVDMYTFISIGQHNRKTRTDHHLWISISAAKILVKKLEDVGEVVEKIEDDSLKKMRPNEVLYESCFLDCEQNNEITLKLLPARDIYFGIFCFGKFDLEIFRKSLFDDSKATHVYVPSSAIHTFKEKLAEILKRYEQLQDPNRSIAFKDLFKTKSFDFGPKRYFLNLSESVEEICILVGEFNPKLENQCDMVIPVTAAELMLPLLGQAYEVILQNEGRLPMGIQPSTSLFEKCFIDNNEEFIVEVQVSELEFRNLGDMVLKLRSQNFENKNKMPFLIIRSNSVTMFLKYFIRMLQEFEKLKSAKMETAKIKQEPKPRPVTTENQLEQQPKPIKELCKPSLFLIGREKFYFQLYKHQVDMFTFVSICQLNLKTRTEHLLWISVPAAKILFKKLESVDEVVEKIGGDPLKIMRHDELLYESGFLDFEMNGEIILKLLSSRNGYIEMLNSGKFYLEIIQKSLLDESKETHIYVSSNVIYTFKEKLAEIFKKYEKLQDPNRPLAFKNLFTKSFVFGPHRYFLNLSEGVQELCILLGESNSESGIKRDMVIPVTAAELMLPLLVQAYEVILQKEAMMIQPSTSLFEKCFIDSDQKFTVQIRFSDMEFGNLGDMTLLLKSQSVENEHKMNIFIIRSNAVPIFLKYFEEMLQEFEKLNTSIFKKYNHGK